MRYAIETVVDAFRQAAGEIRSMSADELVEEIAGFVVVLVIVVGACLA